MLKIKQLVCIVQGVGGAAGDVAHFAPGVRSVGNHRVGRDTLGLLNPVSGNESRAFFLGELCRHLVSQPLPDIHPGIIEQRLGGRRHGVELFCVDGDFRQRRRIGLAASALFADPPGSGTALVDQLFVRIGRNAPYSCQSAHGRYSGGHAVDGSFHLLWHQEAAVRIAQGGGRCLNFQVAQAGVDPLAEPLLERLDVLAFWRVECPAREL